MIVEEEKSSCHATTKEEKKKNFYYNNPGTALDRKKKIALDQLNRCILSFFTIQLRSTSDPIKIVTVIQKY